MKHSNECAPFEELVAGLVQGRQRDGLPQLLAPLGRRLVDPNAPLPGWQECRRVLEQLGMPPGEASTFEAAHEQATRYRRPTRPQPLQALASAQASGSVTPNPTREVNRQRRVPEDIEGHDRKPDPLTEDPQPSTFAELDVILRRYWRWAGRIPTRELARRSGGMFSHATAHKVTGNRRATATAFSARLDYLTAFVAACGGSDGDQRRWSSAWRSIEMRDDDL